VRGRLPRPVGTEEGQEPAGPQGERQSPQRESRPIELLQAFGHQDRSPGAWCWSIGALSHGLHVCFAVLHLRPPTPVGCCAASIRQWDGAGTATFLLSQNRKNRLETTNRLSTVKVIKPPRIPTATGNP